MDKEFEEWISEQYRDSYHGYGRYDMEEAWNASKQYWLDKDRETIERLCDALDEVDCYGEYRALVKEVSGEKIADSPRSCDECPYKEKPCKKMLDCPFY